MGIIPERTPEEQAAHDRILDSAFGEIASQMPAESPEPVEPTLNDLMSQLSDDEVKKVEEIVNRQIHANGMYGHGTGTHLGGENHRKSVIKRVIAERAPVQEAAKSSFEGDNRYGHYYGGGIPDRAPSGPGGQ